MYDEKLKKQYISFNPNNNHQFEKIMTNYFDKAEEIEKRLKKDLSQFTSAEILSMYKQFLTPSFDMLVVINNQFLNYTNWYMKEVDRGDGQNHYAELRDDHLMNCVYYAVQEDKIVTREHLLKDIIAYFQNPCEQFLYLALFEGIKGEGVSDFFNLSMKDFNKKKGIVKLKGREIPFTPQLYSFAHESTNEYVIYNINGEKTRRGRFLEADNRILKCSASSGFETEPEERALIVYRILRKTKRYDFVPKSLTATTLIESGRVHMIRQLMEEQDISDVEECIRKNRPLIELRYDHIPSLPKWLLKYEKFCK